MGFQNNNLHPFRWLREIEGRVREMIIFSQPYGFSAPGGGARILRVLAADAPDEILSVCTSAEPPPPTGSVREVHLPRRPFFGRLEATRLDRYFHYLELTAQATFTRRLRRLLTDEKPNVVHIVPHGYEFYHVFRLTRSLGIPVVVSMHDDMAYAMRTHFRYRQIMDNIGWIWREAERCTVISRELGEEYGRRYGPRPYTVVANGIEKLRPIRRSCPRSLRIYFAGMFHINYSPNLCALLEAFDLVRQQRPDVVCRFIARGGLPKWFQGDPRVEIRSFASESDMASDLDEVDYVYFPLPIGPEFGQFTRTSISAKMIDYLGSGRPMLYHGPNEGAAGKLLDKSDAAIALPGLDSGAIAQTLLELMDDGAAATRVVAGARALAEREFMLEDQRRKFWGEMQSASQSIKTAV